MSGETAPVGLVVAGYGYWGPNIVRNAIERPEFELLALCELDAGKAAVFSRRHPGVPTCRDFEVLLEDPRVDAVAIATPPRTHFKLVNRALEAGKHVLVEKPLATTVAEAEALVQLAERESLVLMPGHTFLYSPPVSKVRDLIVEGELGEIYFITSSRMNLGIYQPDGVVCDLAPHDISILLYWLGRSVSVVAASGCTVFQEGVPETAFLTLSFEEGCTANVQISWLAPRKVRQMVVVGSKRMVQYDDTSSDDIVRVYDRGFDFAEPANFGEYKLTYRSGDMVAPRILAAEPLSLELEDFAAAITKGRQPRSDARLGLEIVRVLEAAHASLQAHGRPIGIERRDGEPVALAGAVPAGALAVNGYGHRPNGNGLAGGGTDHPNGNGRAA
jgi:predicted dehydrogenase